MPPRRGVDACEPSEEGSKRSIRSGETSTESMQDRCQVARFNLCTALPGCRSGYSVRVGTRPKRALSFSGMKETIGSCKSRERDCWAGGRQRQGRGSESVAYTSWEHELVVCLLRRSSGLVTTTT
eukprot:756155-Hanusia_phi.AAC.1